MGAPEVPGFHDVVSSASTEPQSDSASPTRIAFDAGMSAFGSSVVPPKHSFGAQNSARSNAKADDSIQISKTFLEA